MTLTQLDIMIIERPTWSTKGAWFARVHNNTTNSHEDCPHTHSRRDLAHRCATKMIARFITNNNEGNKQ